MISPSLVSATLPLASTSLASAVVGTDVVATATSLASVVADDNVGGLRGCRVTAES